MTALRLLVCAAAQWIAFDADPVPELLDADDPSASSSSKAVSLVESRARSLSGVGPEIPLPMYYSSPDSVLAVGPEGQLEHVSPDQLSPGQQSMVHQISGKYFDGSGHLPMTSVLGVCKQGFHSLSGMHSCVSSLSQMTPTKMHGLKHLLKQGAKTGGYLDENVPDDQIRVLDRGKAMLPSGRTESSEPGAECEFFVEGKQDACREVMGESWKQQKKGATCKRMTINNEGFETSHYAASLDWITPYFTKQSNWHYFDEEKGLRKKYAVQPTAHGCGVVATAAIERGDLVGLAAVAHATYLSGMMVALQETPWLGANLNHCPTLGEEHAQADSSKPNDQSYIDGEAPLATGLSELGANAVMKLVEADHKPTALWIYATQKINPGEEITMDYNDAAKKYPNFVQPAGDLWTCKRRKLKHKKKEHDLRRAGEAPKPPVVVAPVSHETKWAR